MTCFRWIAPSGSEIAHLTRLRNEALASDDFAESRRACGEKRPPKFGG